MDSIKKEPKEVKVQKEIARKKQSFPVKNTFTHGEKEYQKGDTIEVSSEKGIKFLQSKNYI